MLSLIYEHNINDPLKVGYGLKVVFASSRNEAVHCLSDFPDRVEPWKGAKLIGPQSALS